MTENDASREQAIRDAHMGNAYLRAARIDALNADREPKACPDCGDLCKFDGWGLVHPDGVGIGSCREVRRGPFRPTSPEEASRG